MGDKHFLTASHIKYLLVLKKLDNDNGIKSSDVARELTLTKPSVHCMMDIFLSQKYIEKNKAEKSF